MTASNEDAQLTVNARSVLKPLFDQICSYYESKNGKRSDVPTIDNVVDVLNDKVHELSQFFHELDKNKNKKKDIDGEGYVSVCTQKESNKNRCYVSSNGLH